MSRAELDELLLTLARSRVRFIVIGGIAVGVHGYVRGTKDVDTTFSTSRTCPSRERQPVGTSITRSTTAPSIGESAGASSVTRRIVNGAGVRSP
jgi:hypothetical protein